MSLTCLYRWEMVFFQNLRLWVIALIVMIELRLANCISSPIIGTAVCCQTVKTICSHFAFCNRIYQFAVFDHPIFRQASKCSVVQDHFKPNLVKTSQIWEIWFTEKPNWQPWWSLATKYRKAPVSDWFPK